MKMMVAWYAVKDFEVSKKFYSETLGMTTTFEMPGWCEFASGPGEASVGLSAQGEPGAGGATVVLGVDDVEASRKALQAKGVQFLGGIEEIPGVVKIATFADPSGNRLQLCQTLLPA
jgi:predicted enzyme related to lactoylglutathione lyase